MFLKLTIKVVALFLGHPVYLEMKMKHKLFNLAGDVESLILKMKTFQDKRQ